MKYEKESDLYLVETNSLRFYYELKKIKYLDWLYRLDYDKIPYEDLQLLLGASVELANNLYDEQVSEILPLRERKVIKKIGSENNEKSTKFDKYKLVDYDLFNPLTNHCK